jgi:transcriptional regulator with XRE-family HTH domain
MKPPISLKNLRKSMNLTHLEMSELLGMSFSHYSMAEGGHRNLPGSALIRVFEIHKLLEKWEPSENEIQESDRIFLIEELKSLAFKTGQVQKKRQTKHKKETDSARSREILAYLLSNFDLLTPNSTDPEHNRIWKAAMEVKARKPNPGAVRLDAIQNRIESECQALRIRLIQEELDGLGVKGEE